MFETQEEIKKSRHEDGMSCDATRINIGNFIQDHPVCKTEVEE